MESGGNKLASGEPVFNEINQYPKWHKSCYYVDSCQRQKYITVSIMTVAILNIEAKFWTWKNEFPQGSYLCSLTQPEIKIQRHLNSQILSMIV